MTTTPINPQIEASWLPLLQDTFQEPYFWGLKSFLQEERKQYTMYPAASNIFAAFNFTPVDTIKVVILGQDPYHGANQANGFSFSVPRSERIPPSLRNIYKEIQTNYGGEMPIHGDLTNWATQGVFLLNAILTVRANQAASHQGKGWEMFTNTVIQQISENTDKVVFLLWGKYAQDKAKYIDTNKHYILTSAHPSPLSAHNGFLGNEHFKKANAWLVAHEKTPIDWIVT